MNWSSMTTDQNLISILSSQTLTCTNSSSEDPGPSGDRCFYQALSEHLLEFGLQVKVLQAAMHRDEQCGQL